MRRMPPEGVPVWVLAAAAGGLLLFLVLMLIILLVRRRRRKKAALLAREDGEPAGVVLAAPAPAAEGADIMEMKTEKSMELRRDIRKFAEENPEIAAQMVKSWLREGDDGE